MVGFMAVPKLAAALHPPLWGRVGEEGSPANGFDGADAAVLAAGENPRGVPPSLPSRASFARLGPHKGGGNEGGVPASRTNSRPKFSNESNPFLLCMGLFSRFLTGAAARGHS
ncbi:hypothetical protein ACVWXO_002925 [Bradyrhizobium sp. LM2.7]